jgi:hypothetical protein
MEDGLEIKLKNAHTVLVKNSNNIFELTGIESTTSVALNTQVKLPKSTFMTWHDRLRHASEAQIKSILGSNIDLDLKESCSACMKGKMIKLLFNGNFQPTKAVLKVVHGDLLGPI